MRKIIVHEFITLDGVIQAPGGVDEDTDGGFTHGGWTHPYWHDEIGAHFGQIFGDADTLLLGRKTWEEDVDRILIHLERAFMVDYIVLGGGNAKMLEHLPRGVELGHNRNAYLGGQRVWQNNPRTRRPRWTIL